MHKRRSSPLSFLRKTKTTTPTQIQNRTTMEVETTFLFPKQKETFFSVLLYLLPYLIIFIQQQGNTFRTRQIIMYFTVHIFFTDVLLHSFTTSVFMVRFVVVDGIRNLSFSSKSDQRILSFCLPLPVFQQFLDLLFLFLWRW